MFKFLAGLPGILGVAGFFAYIWVGQSRIGGEIFKQIVAKLRTDPNLDVAKYSSLTPAKIGRLIKSDSRVRRNVNEQDQKLLRLLIILQHILTVVVLLACAGLVALSIWLISRPEPLSVSAGAPQAVAADAKGALVDLDPISVQWTSSGKDETVSVFLENVDSGARTKKKTVSSNVRSVRFESSEVSAVATSRTFHGANRIRSVVEWSAGTSVSATQDLLVGVEIELLLNGRLVTPAGKDRTIHTMFATFDQSTEHLPPNYCFSADLVGRANSGVPLVIPLHSCNNNGEVQIKGLDQVDWNKSVGLVYGGPDDPRIVRTEVSGKPGAS
jgi:hypothetical protein